MFCQLLYVSNSLQIVWLMFCHLLTSPSGSRHQFTDLVPRIMLRGVLTVLLFALCSWSACVAELQASAQLPGELTVKVGIKDTFKVGLWTEALVSGQNYQPGDYLVRVSVLDVDGNYATFESSPVTVGEDHQLLSRVPIRILRTGSDVRVSVMRRETTDVSPVSAEIRLVPTGEKRRAQRELTERLLSQPWIVTVGPVDGIELTADFVDGLHVTQVESLSDLPEEILAWQGVDALFLSATELSPKDLKRLERWVQTGGSLLLFPGQSAEEFLNLELVKNLPVKFSGTAQTRDLSRLVSFVGEPSPLRVATMTIPRITDDSAKILVGGLSGPVVVRSSWGLGQLTVVAVNLNERVFQNWAALPQLYRLLANLSSSKSSRKEQESSSSQLTQNGLTDIKTQWVSALSNFGSRPPSIWIPLTGLLMAALLIGPIDYFLVKHVLKRPWLTWVTFPLLILLATAWGLYGNSAGTVQGSVGQQNQNSPATSPVTSHSVLANQCLVLDHSAETGTMRYRSFTKLQGPVTGRYQVQAEFHLPPATDPTSGQCWIGPAAVPEISFRGYYRHSGTHLDQTQYLVDPTALMVQGLPIYERSTSLLEAVGWNSTGADADKLPLVQANLQSITMTQLRGTITHQFEAPISDWVLAYGRMLFFVSPEHPFAVLKPGETLQLPLNSLNQKELSAYLTGTTTLLIKRTNGVGEDLLVKRQPYDVFEQDLNYILSRMTFHQALGAGDYTSLTNTELASWDMSALLDLNQAVLLGRLETPIVSTTVDSAAVATIKNETFVRIVIPVAQRAVVPERLPEFKKSQP